MIVPILIISLILRIILINQSLWLDEAAQVIESARPLSEQLNIGGDFQPPLFHLLLHFWMKLGTSEIWMRLLTVSISIVSIYLFYLIGKKLVNLGFGLLAGFLLAINPYAVYYAQELRPYPLTVFTALLSVWGLINQSSLLLILGMTLFLYTTYFAPFFILSLFVYIYFNKRNKLKWFLKNVLISFIFYLPWLPFFWQQLKTGVSLTKTLPGWSEAVSTPPLKAIPLVFAKFFLGRMTIDNKTIYGLLIVGLTGIFFYLFYTGKKNKSMFIFASVFFITLISVFLTSLFLPIIDPKRVLFILPFFLAIMLLGIQNQSLLLKRLFLGIIISCFLFGLFSYYTNGRFQREHWKEAVSFVEERGDGSQLVLFSFPEPFAPYLWYESKSIDSYGIAGQFIVNENDLGKLNKVIQNRRRLYFFQYLTDLTDPQKRIPSQLEENGFILTNIYDFPGVGFIHQYDKRSLAVAP